MAERYPNTGIFATERTKLITSEDENGGGLEMTNLSYTAGGTFEDQNGRGQRLFNLSYTAGGTFEDQNGRGQRLNEQPYTAGRTRKDQYGCEEGKCHTCPPCTDFTEQPYTTDRTFEEQSVRGQEWIQLKDQRGFCFKWIHLEDQNCRRQEAHCMVCRKSETVRNFNDLQPGDHIEMPMFHSSKNLKLKLPIKHHAIVKEIRQRNEQEDATNPGKNGSQNECHTAQVMVIDVPSAGKTCSKTCCGLLKPGPFKVASHALYDENEINCKKTTIKRVDYHRRRNTHEQTLKNAENYVSMDLTKERYNVCVRNCEHFCAAMVNQDAQTGDNIEKATCLQSARCFWASFHIILSILQFLFYIFNFYLYAVYTRGNERYNHYFGNTSTSIWKWCYTGSNKRGFTTVCDWITFAIVLAVYTVAYICLLCIQYRKRKDVCNQCIISARIVFITKMILFCAIELSNIFGEKYLYAIIDFLNMSAEFTWFVIFFLSLFELLLLFFWVPHVVVKCVVKRCLRCCECHPACCNPCCFVCCCYPWNFDEDSYEYVIHYA